MIGYEGGKVKGEGGETGEFDPLKMVVRRLLEPLELSQHTQSEVNTRV